MKKKNIQYKKLIEEIMDESIKHSPKGDAKVSIYTRLIKQSIMVRDFCIWLEIKLLFLQYL